MNFNIEDSILRPRESVSTKIHKGQREYWPQARITGKYDIDLGGKLRDKIPYFLSFLSLYILRQHMPNTYIIKNIFASQSQCNLALRKSFLNANISPKNSHLRMRTWGSQGLTKSNLRCQFTANPFTKHSPIPHLALLLVEKR